jgi:SMI1 / KNR4 family (SUKH-1)
MEIEPAQIWDDLSNDTRPRGVGMGEIESWEQRSKVPLPDLLRQSLLIQNGGKIRYSQVVVKALEDITPMNQEFWNDAWCDEDEFPDKQLVFAFGESEEGEPLLLLNYNRQGRRRTRNMPAVYSYTHDPGEVVKVAESFEEFLASQIEVSNEPGFMWPESANLDGILFHERILQQGQGGWVEHETIVQKVPGSIRVYCRETAAKEDQHSGEELLRIDLRHPLKESAATIWSGGEVHFLTLESAAEEESSAVRSVKMADGKWKNQSEEPHCDVQSTEKEKLRSLRASLFGRSAF